MNYLCMTFLLNVRLQKLILLFLSIQYPCYESCICVYLNIIFKCINVSVNLCKRIITYLLIRSFVQRYLENQIAFLYIEKHFGKSQLVRGAKLECNIYIFLSRYFVTIF